MRTPEPTPADLFASADDADELHTLDARSKALGRLLDGLFNRNATGPDDRVGFVLAVFPLRHPDSGVCAYMSNSGRGDVATILHRLAARLAGKPDVVGRA